MILNHLDELKCLLFLDRQVDRLRAREISAHSLECIVCRALLHALERESGMLKRAMHEEYEPVPSGRYESRPLQFEAVWICFVEDESRTKNRRKQ